MAIVKKKKAVIQLLLLVGLLILVTCIISWTLKNDVTKKIDTFFNSRTIPVYYDSVLVENQKKKNAGFWQRFEEKKLPEKPYSINDCIEIKDNGIFWQVVQYTLWLSESDSAKIMHVLTGYINPFKADPSDSTTTLVDAFVRAQAFVVNQDTCYVGKETMDLQRQQNIMEMMSEVFASKIRADQNVLYIDDKKYAAYDTVKYPLADFFPLGTVEIVDKFSVEKCLSGYSLSTIVKRESERYLSTTENPITENSVKDIIKNYYQPLIVNLIAKGYTSKVLEPMSGKIILGFDVNGNGTVSGIKIINDKLSNRYFSKRLVGEIATWRFLTKKNGTEIVHINYEFNF